LYVDIGNVKITDQATSVVMLNNGVGTPTLSNATATNGYTNFTNLNPITPLYKEKNYLFQNIPKIILLFFGIFALTKLVNYGFSKKNGIYILLIPLIIHLLHNKTQNFYDVAFWYLYILSFYFLL
jgi:hypothetical protein